MVSTCMLWAPAVMEQEALHVLFGDGGARDTLVERARGRELVQLLDAELGEGDVRPAHVAPERGADLSEEFRQEQRQREGRRDGGDDVVVLKDGQEALVVVLDFGIALDARVRVGKHGDQ